MRNLTKICNASLVAVALLLISQIAVAGERINAKPGGVAVKGYDVVAYFTKGEPTRGNERYTHLWQDRHWLFSSQIHLDAFAAEPTNYAPRYGGFCAGGVALGNRVQINPEAFVIVDGRLYLNYDKPTAEEFEATASESIAKADANWQQIGFTE